jgi:ParB family transcriptional regulator, chromosome partitioning protein
VTKEKRLGRGLAALLGTPIEGEGTDLPAGSEAAGGSPAFQTGNRKRTNGSSAETTLNGTSSVSSSELNVSLIDANPFQPRREFNEEEIASLAESLKAHQQLQPILVRPVGDRYQLISGERRLRATIHAGLSTIRAEIREADDRLVAELAIIENLQRKDLNAIEKAMSFKRYIQEHRCTQEDLANRLKIDRSTVTNFMRLLELPKAILTAVEKEQISAGHARAILSLGTDEQQLDYARRIQSEGWSVRETERRVAEQVAKEEDEEDGLSARRTRVITNSRAKSEHIAALEGTLKRTLGTQIDIHQTARGRGKIVIHFSNKNEFERLRALLEEQNQASKRAA